MEVLFPLAFIGGLVLLMLGGRSYAPAIGIDPAKSRTQRIAFLLGFRVGPAIFIGALVLLLIATLAT